MLLAQHSYICWSPNYRPSKCRHSNCRHQNEVFTNKCILNITYVNGNFLKELGRNFVSMLQALRVYFLIPKCELKKNCHTARKQFLQWFSRLQEKFVPSHHWSWLSLGLALL
jgi:hypothetical protein